MRRANIPPLALRVWLWLACVAHTFRKHCDPVFRSSGEPGPVIAPEPGGSAERHSLSSVQSDVEADVVLSADALGHASGVGNGLAGATSGSVYLTPPAPACRAPPPPPHRDRHWVTQLQCARTTGLMAENVYGGDIQSIDTDH